MIQLPLRDHTLSYDPNFSLRTPTVDIYHFFKAWTSLEERKNFGTFSKIKD